MDVVRRPMRYAHADGHTDGCYADDGKYFITCGDDGDIRKWCGLEDDDPKSECVGETVYAVAAKDNRVYVATESNNVHAYAFPDLEKDGIICGFSAPVTHIVPSQDGKKIICGSRDMTIQVCEIESHNFETLLGHAGPILGVSVDPQMKYVASSSCDGTIRIWSLNSLKCVHVWSCLPHCNSFTKAKCLGRTSWFPESGKYIAVPDKTSIDLYQRDTWDQIKSFSHEEIKQPFSIATFSPCGQYIAGSTISGEICIWNCNPTSCLSYTEHPLKNTITAMAWNPANDGVISYCDAMGQFGTVEGCKVSGQAKLQEQITDDGMNNKIFDSDKEDDENSISLDHIKDSASDSYTKFANEELNDKDNDDDDDAESKANEPSFKAQPPFQPSSSPAHLQHRYMVWNSVGMIRCFNTEEENSIDVEFHDTSLHHSMHMQNLLKHSLASLSEKALLLACEAEDLSHSKIVCVLLNSWDGTREWTVELPEGEEVLAIACANDWLAAATDVRNLRFFSIGGNQREILCLPGPIVCLAAHEDMLLVVFHHGIGLNYGLLHVKNTVIESLVSSQPLPLTPQASLQWAGFSDEGTPCIVDSVGVVRMLSPNVYWLIICETQKQCKGKSDQYFIIGISEKYENIRCILCKGSHYPPTTPRPTAVEIPMKIPLCDISSEKSNLEGDFWRSQILLNSLDKRKTMNSNSTQERNKAENTIKETVIKLFALACRNGLDLRALDLCKMMSSEEKQLAIKYATKLRKFQLTERIAQICDETSMKTSQMIETYSRFPSTSRFPSNKRKEVQINEVDQGKTDSFTLSEEPSTSKNFILLAASKEKKDPPVSIFSPMSQRRVNNPFRKQKPVELTANDNINGNKNMNKNISDSKTSLSSATGKTKQVALWEKIPSSGGSSTKIPTFREWYSEHKESLQEEFPELESVALTYVAMNRFKESKAKVSDSKSNENSLSSQNSEIDSSVHLLNSGSEHSQNSVSGDLQNSLVDIFSEPFISDTSDSEKLLESKKRKIDKEDISEASGSSKLAKFAFKK